MTAGLHLIALLVVLLLSGIESFSKPSRSQLRSHNRLKSAPYDVRLFADASNKHSNSRRIVVVGKIIIDQYGDPSMRTQDDASKLTVGGGGPQACWGAAAALACRDHYFRDTQPHKFDEYAPPKQLITFIAPIGKLNWSQKHTHALERILPPFDVSPVLIESEHHITPTINIWHDANEIQKWHPVDGSFDSIGADGLWRNRPSANDILAAVHTNESIILHCILESGSSPAGQGEDSLFINSSELMNRISVLGIEPIVFPNEITQKVSDEDGLGVHTLMSRATKSLPNNDQLLIFTPDRACFDSLMSINDDELDAAAEIVVRDGANGSFMKQQQIPSATLQTPNNKPHNPTGAGNAYSAAYVACRGTGSTSEEAAVLATAVGAVVCEYEHLPDWSWGVLERIADAAKEVEAKLNKSVLSS